MDLPAWLERASPGTLGAFLGTAASPRKRGLYVRHLCRSFPGVFADPRSAAALDAADRYEAGEIDEPAYRAAVRGAEVAADEALGPGSAVAAARLARDVAAGGYDKQMLTVLGRLAGPTNSRHSTPRKRVARAYRVAFFEHFGDIRRPVALDPAWLTPTAVALAEAIYADRAWDRLPILADALEDAGCDSAGLLAHLRGDGPHVRGCWAVDLVLGRG